MQAVILAAGRGSRMGKLTESIPKPLLEVAGFPLIQYGLEAIPDSIEEIIIVVGYLGGVIHDRFGPEYNGKRLLYVEMEQLHGTAAALWQAKDILKDRFLVLPGDDLYSRRDAEAVAASETWALGVKRIPSLRDGGQVLIDSKGHIHDIVEGAHDGGEGLIYCSLACLDTRIFSQPMIHKASGSDEFGLPQTVLASARALHVNLKAIEIKDWIQITTPEDIKRAEELIAH